MANIADVNLSAVLPTRNVERFKELFNTKEGVGEKREYFQVREVQDFKTVRSNKHGMSLVTCSFGCEWSMKACLIDESDKGNTVEGMTRLTLDDAIKELGIIRVIANGYCMDCDGFEEVAHYDFDEGDTECEYECRDLYPDHNNMDLYEEDEPLEEDEGEKDPEQEEREGEMAEEVGNESL